MQQNTPMRPHEADWPEWMKTARHESGVTEVPGSGISARIREYYGATRGQIPRDDDVPWCAAFTCWCLEQAGYVSTRSKRARDYLLFGDVLSAPRFGCVMVFSRSSPKNPMAGHVGFYAGPIDAEHVWILGGNQGNKVGTASRKMSEFLGARWPVDKLHHE